MTTTIPDAAFPTQLDILNAMLAGLRFYYARLNPPIVRNVLPGSDDYVRLQQVAGRVTIAIANSQVAIQNSSPIDATGDALTKLASFFGVFPRAASSGTGFAIATFTGANIAIPTGFTASATNGKQFTATPGTYGTGALIPITAVDAGADTNLPAGSVLQWDSSAIANLNPLATVSTSGVTGGLNADGDEQLRTRLLEALAAIAGGGNWAFIVNTATSTSAAIEASYAYSAVQEAGSYDVAVTLANFSRVVPTAIVQQVAATVTAAMPGQSQGTFTSVTPQYVDAGLYFVLPLPSAAGGAGGGYLDAAPWPHGEDVKITNVSGTTMTCNATNAPLVGNQIGIWDPTYTDPTTKLVGLMRQYSIVSVGGSSGAYTFQAQGLTATTATSDNGLTYTNWPLGQYVSTGALHLADYAKAVAGSIAVLGPGEKTNLPDLLPRSLRMPAVDISNPSSLTRKVLDVLDQYGELEDNDYTFRVGKGNPSGGTQLTSPSVPNTTADPPNILVLSSLSFRAQ